MSITKVRIYLICISREGIYWVFLSRFWPLVLYIFNQRGRLTFPICVVALMLLYLIKQQTKGEVCESLKKKQDKS